MVLEAEVADGDVTQIVSAIQNALRPSQPPAIARQISSRPNASHTDVDYDHTPEPDEEFVDVEASEATKRARPTRPRAVRPPRVVDGIDFDTEPSIVEFTTKYDLKTDFEKYLAIALWFREHRDTPAVTAGHIYTAYRHLGWPTSIPDFTKPLRNMKDNQLFTGGSKDGFAINQLGEGKLRSKIRA